jgi:hypothetical protein
MDSKKKVCHRSGKTIYPADKQVNFGGFDFLATHFTCKATGTRLTLKTATVIDGEVYLRGETATALGATSGKVQMETNKGCYQGVDVIGERVSQVPDANMRTDDRMFNVSGKQAHRGTKGEDAGSNYGTGAVSVETAVNNPDPGMRTDARRFKIADVEGSNYGPGGKVLETHTNIHRPPTTVNNINMQEKRHNGVDKYRGVEQ